MNERVLPDQGSTLMAALLPRAGVVRHLTEGQVNIRVCLPYMAGKISSFNFKERYYRHKGNSIFFNSSDKAIAGKLLSGSSIVQTEKSLSCSFYHTFCRTGQNFLGQVNIKVALQKLMLSPVDSVHCLACII